MLTLLGLAPPLARAAFSAGMSVPTTVQSAVFELIIAQKDLLVTAPTGTGKSAAYLLPLLQMLLERGPVLSLAAGQRRPLAVLVLVPTRELARQVQAELEGLLPEELKHLKTLAVYGGVSINPQLMNLRGGVDVLVATPGRLQDLLDHRGIQLGSVRALVLDEADRLLDEGFSEQLDKLLLQLPAQRQTLLFSATFADRVQALSERWQKQPQRLLVEGSSQIRERAVRVDDDKRTALLRHYLAHTWHNDRVLVFVASKYRCDLVVSKLQKAGIWAQSFHGDMSQSARLEALEAFRQERWQVLVTTDLAARGIDIPDLPVVVNYDLPRSADDYQHRIGRTGRAGASGLALSFVSHAAEQHFRLIEKRSGKRLPRELEPGFEPQQVALAPADPSGGIKGRRPSKKDKLRAAKAQE